MADPMVDIILEAGLKKSPTEVAQVVTDHRLGMAAENILGSLLEEYISIHVQDHGWYCCWGNTVRHVDFCSKVGGLLQIKNRSNSENSSSNKVRAGTDIVRWFRIDAASGETYWERLCQISGSQDLSEVGFKTFIQNTLKTNPGLLPA